MGSRTLKASAALAAVLLMGVGGSARAQFGMGYGGWGGWGMMMGGETVAGANARGLGMLNVGAGVYNEKTAVANSINTDTVMRWNEYLYQSNVNAARTHRARLAQRQEAVAKTGESLEDRLRNNPTERDILQGSALNVAVEQISDPRVYTKALTSAKAKVGGPTIRNIPFQSAAQAISTSVYQITRGGVPRALQAPIFEADRAELRKIIDKIRAETEEGKDINPADLEAAQAKLLKIRKDFETTVKRNSPGYAEADRFLKAAYGLTRMLETPAMNVLLAGVESRPDIPLSELLNFMTTFNLRFGPATTPDQRAAYQKLWPMVDKVRDETVAALAETAPATATETAANHEAAADFFSGVEHEALIKKPTPAPVPAPPQPK